MIGPSNAKHMKVLAQNGAILHIIADNNRNGYAPDVTVSLYKGNVFVRQFDVNDEFRIYQEDIAESDNESDYLYEITPENYGTWSVVASSGGFSNTKTVIIDSAKEYIVAVRMTWWFQSGFGECFKDDGSTILTTEAQSSASVSVTTNYITMTYAESGPNCSSVYSPAWLMNSYHIWNNVFKASRYTYTEAVFDIEVLSATETDYRPRLLVAEEWPTNGAVYSNDIYAVRSFLEAGDRTTISLDISNVSGAYFTGITGQCNVKIYNMYWA